MKKMLIVLLLFGTVFLCFAGEPESELDPVAVNLAYFAHFIRNPGVICGIDIPLLGNKYNCMYSATNIGFYTQPYINTPVFLYSELGYRFTFRFGLNFHFAFGGGYMHSFLNGDVYEIVDGNPRQVMDMGRPMAMGSALIGMGWNLQKSQDIPVDIFARVQFLPIGPINSHVIAYPVFQLGTRIFIY